MKRITGLLFGILIGAILLGANAYAANSSTTSFSFTIIKDTTAPAISSVPADGAVNIPQDVTIVVTGTDTQSPVDYDNAIITVQGVVIAHNLMTIDTTNPKSVKFSYKPAAVFGLGESVAVSAQMKDTAK